MYRVSPYMHPYTSLTVCSVPDVWTSGQVCGCMASNGATAKSAVRFKLISGSDTDELWLRGTPVLLKPYFMCDWQKKHSLFSIEIDYWWEEVLPFWEEPRLVWLHHRPSVMFPCSCCLSLPQTPKKTLPYRPQQQ